MPFQPTSGDVHVNRPLTNISVAFLQQREDFVATRAFRQINVSKQSDRYFLFDRGEFNRNEMMARAPATESAGSGYSIDNTPTYFANVFAFHKDIPDMIRANVDDPLNLDREAAEYVSHKAMIKRETDWAADFFTTGVWTTDITGVSAAPTASEVLQWNDSSSTPIQDVRAGRTTVKQETAYEPNVMVIGRQVWDQLADHPDIIDRIKYGQTSPGPAIVSRNTVAQVMELDEILVMQSIENTAVEGQTASHSFIGGTSALLLYRPPRPGLMTPAAGYTFAWTGYLGGAPDGVAVSNFTMPLKRADRIEIEMAYDQSLVSADLGYFFTTVVA